MAGNDWEKFGEEIRKTVQDAVEEGDYTALNQTIVDALDRALGSTMDTVSRGVWTAKNDRYRGRITKDGLNARRNKSPVRKQEAPVLYKKNTGVSIPGLFAGVAGGVAGAGFGMVGLSGLLAGLISGFSAPLLLGTFMFLIPAAASFALMGYGIHIRSMDERFKKYVRKIGGREYCDVSELAQAVGKKEEKVVADLQGMIDRRWFLQGHFDESRRCLITSDRMYKEYKQLSLERKAEEDRLAAKRRDEIARAKELDSKYPPEAQKVLRDGDAFVRKIHECNDAIPGEEISAKISHMEMIVDRIFERVEEDPESVSDVRKMMDYYLPTTIKLLEAYRELARQPVAGENIQTSKKEIEDTLDTLNAAFEKILDDLFHRKAWDVSTDISVLNTVLAQEGLKEEDWRMNNGE